MSAQVVTHTETPHHKWRLLINTSVYVRFKVSLMTETMLYHHLFPLSLSPTCFTSFSLFLQVSSQCFCCSGTSCSLIPAEDNPLCNHFFSSFQHGMTNLPEVEVVFLSPSAFLSSLLWWHCGASQSQESFQVETGSVREIFVVLQGHRMPWVPKQE